MTIDANILMRAAAAQTAVLDGIVQKMTVGGDEVATTWTHLETEPDLKVTDIAIAGIRVAGRGLEWVLAEYGGDATTRMVRAMQLYSELDLSAARRTMIRLEQEGHV